jgi:predicted DNA-binding transcriptional regulator AlpA
MLQESPATSILPADERIISEKEAAEACGISVATLRRTVAAGKGPSVIRLSERRIGYRLRDLRIWLDSNAEEPDLKPAA